MNKAKYVNMYIYKLYRIEILRTRQKNLFTSSSGRNYQKIKSNMNKAKYIKRY